NDLTLRAAASSAPTEPTCDARVRAPFGSRPQLGRPNRGALTIIKLGMLGSGAAVLALVLGAPTLGVLIAAQPAQADDCLLDTNDNGTATATTDTDGGAASSGIDTRLACGVGATASGSSSTAVGGSALAT